jgi:D-aminoacyl-tRNA deacylase
MRVVIQRVKKASVEIQEREHAAITFGLLVLLGIEESDTIEDVEWLCGKIVRLRIFEDENGVMNKSLQDADGEILLISQFTLHASTKKGNRPSYIRAARPETAVPLYEQVAVALAAELGPEKVKTGVFGAMMDISLVNSGPVTILIDTKNKE